MTLQQKLAECDYSHPMGAELLLRAMADYKREIFIWSCRMKITFFLCLNDSCLVRGRTEIRSHYSEQI